MRDQSHATIPNISLLFLETVTTQLQGLYRQHLKMYFLNLAIGDTDYTFRAVAAAAAAGAERHNTRQVTTLCMQVIWSDRLCVCSVDDS